ncbi:hypothetical protein DH2020_047473 [Rehmannia glutinosa]|uniref:Sphingomyelin synthase-like domain-containing protein n=1 Tax=Rehmannia glutinosa TaxID=99300 RepID=A0ABR0U925_REHGL
MRSPPISRPRHGGGGSVGLGIAAIVYVSIDYLRHFSPAWHERLQPALWAALAIAAVIRVPFYKHWSLEMRAAIPFIFSIIFMLSALLFEMISVRSVTAVLGLDWHNGTPPLPDVGQWLLLALNEKLPQIVVDVLRARIIGLHHYLMLFVMLAFSVLFNSVEAPGLGLGARYMFTMGIGRLLRAISFVSTILPSPRPWCASGRFKCLHIHIIGLSNITFPVTGEYGVDFQPNWGSMNFLADFLRPTANEGLLHVLTAMAWTEAYGGFTSVIIWMLVAHSAQREIRERHHYSVDCIVAIYMGILLWKMTGLFWPIKDTSRYSRLDKLEKIQSKLVQAAKDSDIDGVRELLKEVELSSQVSQKHSSKAMWLFSGATIFFAIVIVLLAFTLTSDG